MLDAHGDHRQPQGVFSPIPLHGSRFSYGFPQNFSKTLCGGSLKQERKGVESKMTAFVDAPKLFRILRTRADCEELQKDLVMSDWPRK